MKKLIPLALLLVTSCENVPVQKDTFEIVRHELMNSSESVWVLTDKQTGCQYLWTTGSITLRYDPNGKVAPKCVKDKTE